MAAPLFPGTLVGRIPLFLKETLFLEQNRWTSWGRSGEGTRQKNRPILVSFLLWAFVASPPFWEGHRPVTSSRAFCDAYLRRFVSVIYIMSGNVYSEIIARRLVEWLWSRQPHMLLFHPKKKEGKKAPNLCSIFFLAKILPRGITSTTGKPNLTYRNLAYPVHNKLYTSPRNIRQAQRYYKSSTKTYHSFSRWWSIS